MDVRFGLTAPLSPRAASHGVVGYFRTLTVALGGAIFLSLAVPSPVLADNEAKKGTVVEIDGLQSTTPTDWNEEEPPENSRKMRYKQFRLESNAKDKDAALLVIFFFGTGGGGPIEQNLRRWKDMFIPAEGKNIDEVSKVQQFQVSKVPVTYLDVRGTYLFKARPFDPGAQVTRQPNYRLLGVVFESEKGPYFFRLTGPAEVVERHKKGFDDWLKGFK